MRILKGGLTIEYFENPSDSPYKKGISLPFVKEIDEKSESSN